MCVRDGVCLAYAGQDIITDGLKMFIIRYEKTKKSDHILEPRVMRHKVTALT